MREEQRRSAECSFIPEINDMSRQLLLPPGVRLGDSEDSFYQRYRALHQQRSWEDITAADGSKTTGCGVMDMQLRGAELERKQEYDSLYGENAHPNRINLKEPEKMVRAIRQQRLEREEWRRSELVAREMNELQECTFQPQVTPYNGDPHRR